MRDCFFKSFGIRVSPTNILWCTDNAIIGFIQESKAEGALEEYEKNAFAVLAKWEARKAKDNWPVRRQMAAAAE